MATTRNSLPLAWSLGWSDPVRVSWTALSTSQMLLRGNVPSSNFKKNNTEQRKKIKRGHPEKEPSPTQSSLCFYLRSHSDNSFVPATLMLSVPLLTDSAWPLVLFTVCVSRTPFKSQNFRPQSWSSKQHYWILATKTTKPRGVVAWATSSHEHAAKH